MKFTREQWFSLPLPLRVKWWQQTDYGQKLPPPELASEISAALQARNDQAAE